MKRVLITIDPLLHEQWIKSYKDKISFSKWIRGKMAEALEHHECEYEAEQAYEIWKETHR